jgi:serine/threonine-protein kinase RsbT
MPVLKRDSLPIRSETDVVLVRQLVRKWAIELAFSLVDQTKIVTAASELARNTLIHGGGGGVQIESLAEGSRKGLRLTFEDQGPGIPGSKRLMSEFDLVSRVGEGTSVRVVKWK